MNEEDRSTEVLPPLLFKTPDISVRAMPKA